MAVTTDPVYPIPGDQVTISVTSTAATDFALELRTVPGNSLITPGMLTEDGFVVPGPSLLDSRDFTNIFVPDKPGEYTFTAYHRLELSPVPSFQEDPGGETRFTLVTTSTEVVMVGALIDLPIKTIEGHDIELRLTVVDETIRAAELANPTTEKARIAAEQSAVTTPLAALVGLTVAGAGASQDIWTRANNLRTNYEAHRVLVAGDIHSGADSTNNVNQDAANSIDGAIQLIRDMYTEVLNHLRDASSAGGRWHPSDDFLNLPLTAPSNTLTGATVVLSELRERVYERHRVQTASPNSHNNPDGTNILSAPSSLDNVIVAYLDALAADSPTAPTGEPEGIQDAMHRYGFVTAKDRDIDTSRPAVVITGGTADAAGSGVVRTVTSVTFAMSPYTPTIADYILACASLTGAINITPSATLATGRIIEIKDADANAFTNNITVTAPGGQTIDGASTYVLRSDGENAVICKLNATTIGVL